ncbi:MAG TPA: NADH-quinone oxidoreductase subunit C [Vicinamibacterales bacterium]|nr:NADH-quinone oxidoreductase subunit C [Vicinamibacterales bacterium]
MFDLLAQHLAAGSFEPAPAADGMPTMYVARERLVATMRALRDTPELRFAFLADIAAVDYHPREPRYEVVYLLASLGTGGFGDTAKRLRVKVRVPGGDPSVPTIAELWKAANWAERELWDLFGIRVDGHPDLRRILMPEDWDGHPMRRDYPVQIKDPVKTYEPLQVSEEEFVANIEASRDRSKRR